MTPFAQDVIDAVVAVADAAPLERLLALAVVSVETRGIPFESDGRPSFRCEPATFYKELPLAKRASAVAAGIAAAKWSRDGYRDQGTEVGRRARLQRMVAVDERAAYRSISMGLPQAMGFDHSLCGYPDAKAMFEAFHYLAAQARALIALLPALGCMEALKAHDWTAFATRYNGPGERDNDYDRKLADAYAHWEFALAAGQVAPPAEGLGLWSPHGEPVAVLQRALTAVGLPVKVDGWYGPKTAEAVSRFELRKGMADTKGVATQEILDAIVNAAPVPQGSRDVVDAATLRQSSRIVQGTAKLKAVAATTIGGGLATAAADPVASANSAMDKADAARGAATRAVSMVGGAEHAQTALAWLAAHPLPLVGLLMAAVGGVAFYLSHGVEQARVDDARSGATA